MKISFKNIFKNIYEALRSASLYTVIVSVILLVFIDRTGFDTAAIVFRDYLTIFFASLSVAYANLLFKIKHLPRFIAFVLHYLVVALGLVVVFILSDKLLLQYNTSQAFSLLFVYTVLYIFFALVFYFVKRITASLSKNSQSVSQQNHSKKAESTEEEYRSIL